MLLMAVLETNALQMEPFVCPFADTLTAGKCWSMTKCDECKLNGKMCIWQQLFCDKMHPMDKMNTSKVNVLIGVYTRNVSDW